MIYHIIRRYVLETLFVLVEKLLCLYLTSTTPPPPQPPSGSLDKFLHVGYNRIPATHLLPH
jgi:hypothetical protein